MKRMILISALIVWIGVILFLSFQTGPDTAGTSLGLTEYILQFFYRGDIPQNVLEHWHMVFRLWAHPAIFFFYGTLIMAVMMEFTGKSKIAYGVAIFSGILLSVLTEVGKWNIPGRHCDIKEMLLNIAGVMIGTSLMLLVYLIKRSRSV